MCELLWWGVGRFVGARGYIGLGGFRSKIYRFDTDWRVSAFTTNFYSDCRRGGSRSA